MVKNWQFNIVIFHDNDSVMHKSVEPIKVSVCIKKIK